jgi:hypothetical protein
MFSSRSVYRTYAETSLLARRPMPSTCVELGGTSDSITMSYQVEKIVVPALAHVVGSGITVDCGIMYVPNGW